MTAFVPALNKPIGQMLPAQTKLTTTTQSVSAAKNPLLNIHPKSIGQPKPITLTGPMAASLREPSKQLNHEDFGQALSRLIPKFFGHDTDAENDKTNALPHPEAHSQAVTDEDPTPDDPKLIDLSKIDFKKLWMQAQGKSPNSPETTSHAEDLTEANAEIDPAYLDLINIQAAGTDANAEADTEIETTPENSAPRLPIPSGLGNLFGGGEKHNAVLNAITLQTPWRKNLKDKEIMTLLKLGLMNRFVYQKMAKAHHEAHVTNFEKSLAEAGYKLKTVSVGDNLWGLVAHRNNEVLLSFRGTAFWDDMWRNIQIWPSLDKTVPENECTHHGMSHVFEQLWPKIDKTLAEISKTTRRPLQVYVSGHSLGGSFAKLTALRLSNKQKAGQEPYKAQARMVCTYGAPKTFFVPSAARYRELGLDHKTITITQHQDIVPELPPNFLSPYETVGNRLYITRDGSLWYKPENGCVDEDKFRETPEEAAGNGRPNRWVSDHVLDSYLLVLQAYANAKLPKPLPPGSCPATNDQMIKLK